MTLTLDLGKGHTYLSIGCVFSGILRSLGDGSAVQGWSPVPENKVSQKLVFYFGSRNEKNVYNFNIYTLTANWGMASCPLNYAAVTYNKTRLMTLSRTTQVSWYQKGKTNLNLLEQEIGSGSGISCTIYKSAPCPKQITTPVSHHTVLQVEAQFHHYIIT